MQQGNSLRHTMTARRNDACGSYDHPTRNGHLAAAGVVPDGDDFGFLVYLDARFAAGERQSEHVRIGVNTELGRACFQCLSAVAPDKNISISQIAWNSMLGYAVPDKAGGSIGGSYQPACERGTAVTFQVTRSRLQAADISSAFSGGAIADPARIQEDDPCRNASNLSQLGELKSRR
jgi:hypothetical protein